MTADHLVHALIVATALSLVATPFARRLALAVNIVDRPGVHKSHSRTTPYLGGLAIIVAAHAGAFAGDGITSTTGRVLLVATLVGGGPPRRQLPDPTVAPPGVPNPGGDHDLGRRSAL